MRNDRVVAFYPSIKRKILQAKGYNTTFIDFFDFIDYGNNRQKLIEVIRDKIEGTE